MKNIIKAFPFALAFLAFAGCSSDEGVNAAGDSQASSASASQLFVTMEEPQEEDGTTRSFLSRDLKTRMYDTDDELLVYDVDMFRYDFYRFGWNDESHQKGVFTRLNDPSFLTKDPTWALFPSSAVDHGFWNLDKQSGETSVNAVIRIGLDEEGNAAPIIYHGTYQASDTEHSKPLYAENAPRWGKVTLNGTALNTSLSYLTALLRVQLAGVPAGADHLRIQMFKGSEPLYISGEFTAVLAINDVKQPGASLKADSYSKGSGDTQLIVDLTQASDDLQGTDKTKAVVFVPLVTTAEPVDIVVSASNDGGSTYSEIIRLKDKTVQRAKVYGNTTEYDFAGSREGTNNAVSEGSGADSNGQAY